MSEAATGVVSRVQSEVVREARLLQRNGTSEIRLRLHPPELGRLKVQIQVRKGELTVRIEAENPELREALQGELWTLTKALRSAQLDVNRLEVSDYESGTRDEWHGESAPEGNSRPDGRASEQPSHADSAAAAQGWAYISESGRVDCLV